MKLIIITFVLVGTCWGDVSHILPEYSTTTLPPVPRPYSFQYGAGRYPGHVDRVHQETSDGSGTIYGSYSFVDPKNKVRTVDYVADQSGFHPLLKNYEDTLSQPVDSKAVRLAKEKHHRLYESIANRNSQGSIYIPRESASVAKARDKHLRLFDKIAEEHAIIAAQREAERLKFEATSVPNDTEDHSAFLQ